MATAMFETVEHTGTRYAPWAGRRRLIVLPSPLGLLDSIIGLVGRNYPLAVVNFAVLGLACLFASALLLAGGASLRLL